MTRAMRASLCTAEAAASAGCRSEWSGGRLGSARGMGHFPTIAIDEAPSGLPPDEPEEEPLGVPGPAPDEDELDRIQSEHLAYLASLRSGGQVVVNGPVVDQPDESWRGLTFFRTGSLEEAKAMAEQDPAVKAGRLRLEWHPWFAAKNISVTAKAAPAAK